MKAIKIKKIAQDEIMNELNTTEGEKLEKVSVIEEPNFKDVDSMVDPEALRAYVKELMVEVKSNLSSSHPSILKGENVETVVRETERYKKTCETAQRKMNEIRV
jgi:autonomous glycyl radical cofactor GrcA